MTCAAPPRIARPAPTMPRPIASKTLGTRDSRGAAARGPANTLHQLIALAHVVEAALRAPTASLPAWVGVDLGTSGYAVVKVEAIVPRDAQASRNREREREQFSQWWSTAEGLAYYRHLKSEFKVTTKATGL